MSSVADTCGNVFQRASIIGSSREAEIESGPQCLWCGSFSLLTLFSLHRKNSCRLIGEFFCTYKTARHVNAVDRYQMPLSLQHQADGAGREL